MLCILKPATASQVLLVPQISLTSPSVIAVHLPESPLLLGARTQNSTCCKVSHMKP